MPAQGDLVCVHVLPSGITATEGRKMLSLTAAARELGVSRPVVEDLAAAGCLGEVVHTPSGHFVSDERVAAIGAAPVVRTADDITDANTLGVVREVGLVVARVQPWRVRNDGSPETVIGYSPDHSGASGQGYDRYWSLGPRAEMHINRTIKDRGGQPFVVSVRGFVVATHKVVSAPTRTDHGVVFNLANSGPWGEGLIGCWLVAGGGPVLTYWPAEFRDAVKSRR